MPERAVGDVVAAIEQMPAHRATVHQRAVTARPGLGISRGLGGSLPPNRR